jgi:hypothetical protein
MEKSHITSSESSIEQNFSQADAQGELTREGKPLKPRLSIQERFGKAAAEGIAAGRKMTGSQALAQARRNSGWTHVESRKRSMEGDEDL